MRTFCTAIERVARLGAQLLLQSALEGEVSAFLGRDRYQRAAVAEEARAGIRPGTRVVHHSLSSVPLEGGWM